MEGMEGEGMDGAMEEGMEGALDEMEGEGINKI